MMVANIFVSRSKSPPRRWQEAFPQARIVSDVPNMVSKDTVVWLHNLLPGKDGISVPEGVRFVVLQDVPSEEKGLVALGEGAVGYGNSHSAPQLLQTIESVVRNEGLWVGEALLARLLRTLATVPAVARKTAPAAPSALASLTERELEVAEKIAAGESNKEIARDLQVTERTVKAHLSSIFAKLTVRDRLQLALLLKTASR
jgi:DNA-binding NarL/FixJ family response regulator